MAFALAVAVVTCPWGVLVGRRRDGNPPWVFPGGKIEPGESPEDAAAREVLEETGVRVRATGIIGSRAHPRTGVAIAYVAAVPLDEADAGVSDEGLDVVRWVSFAEADQLMGDMSEVVRRYLWQALRP
jgi:8-oxo-dGTP pyrophosphatase MutT (NUDIX family)